MNWTNKPMRFELTRLYQQVTTSKCLRNIYIPTSLNRLSLLACRAFDYVYIDYVRRSRCSLYRLLRPINCQIYITLQVTPM